MKALCDGSLKINFTGLYQLGKDDWLLMPEIGWDFQNGGSATISFAVFEGDENTLFGSYNDKDLVSLTFRYHF